MYFLAIFIFVYTARGVFMIETDEARIMKEVYMLQAVKLFCSSNNLTTNFCSKENLKYMFWDRPNDFEKVIEYLSKPSRNKSDSQTTTKTKDMRFSSNFLNRQEESDMKKQMVFMNNRRFDLFREFLQPRYL